jgi:hypothetical protein
MLAAQEQSGSLQHQAQCFLYEHHVSLVKISCSILGAIQDSDKSGFCNTNLIYLSIP